MGRLFAISIVSANLVMAVFGVGFLKGGGAIQPWVTATVWMGPAVSLILLGLRGRPLSWELVLPEAPVVLWRRHLMGTMTLGLMIWASTTASIWLMFGLIKVIGGSWPTDPRGLFLACLYGGIGLVPLAVWFHGRRPELRTIKVSLWVDGLVVAFVLAVSIAASKIPVPALAGLASLAVGLSVLGRNAVPSAWSIPVIRGENTAAPSDQAMTSTRWRWSADLRMMGMIYRAAPRGVLMILFLFPSTILFGVLLGGGAERLMPDTEMRLLFLPMAAYILLAGMAFPLAGLRAVDFLPVGRNRLLGVILAPYVASLLLGYAGGAVWSRTTVPEGEQILFVDEEDQYGLMVPLRLFEASTENVTPIVEAPWGERHDMMVIPVFGEDITGEGPVLWKPFTVPRGASVEYAGWQLSRALQELHGKTFDPVELSERYFVVDADGDVSARGGELSFAADHPDLRNRGAAPMLPMVLGLLGILWLVPLAIYLRVCRVRYTARTRKTVLWSQMGVLLILHLIAFISPALGWFQPDRFEVAVASGLRQLTATLTGGATLLWVPTLFILTAAMWLVVRNFRVLEADHAACSVCLMGSNDEGKS